jgi:hypothetical protein
VKGIAGDKAVGGRSDHGKDGAQRARVDQLERQAQRRRAPEPIDKSTPAMAGLPDDLEFQTWQRQLKELGHHNINEPENFVQDVSPSRDLRAPRASVFDAEPKSPKNGRNLEDPYAGQHESGARRRNEDDWLTNQASAAKLLEGLPPRQEPTDLASVPH